MTEPGTRLTGSSLDAPPLPDVRGLRCGLPLLLRAYVYVQDVATTPWDFTLEIKRRVSKRLPLNGTSLVERKGRNV